MLPTIGIFADRPTMPTGMAVVCKNLALGLSNFKARIIYFGRFGQQVGFAKQPAQHDHMLDYEYVPCEGGVWRPRTVIEAVEHYGVDYIFSEDDFFSATGLVRASIRTGKPLHFLTPIDSLPIHNMAKTIFSKCKKVYVPNSSYKRIKNGVFLPHGVDTSLWFPQRVDRDPDKFTFLWVGRDEPRKALGRAILAFEKVLKKCDCQMIIHSDWRSTLAMRTNRYLRKKNMPITRTQMEYGNEKMLNAIYNTADVLICTSKAGAYEMAITEAKACGKPVMVTDWTFMNELVTDQTDGYKIPVASICEDTTTLYNGKRWGVPLGRKWGEISINVLASAMQYLCNNPEVSKAMGVMGITDITTNKDRYNWFNISNKLFKEIVEC